jgi:hypothetical protein
LFASAACERQRFVLTEDKAARFSGLHRRLGFEFGNEVERRRLCAGNFERSQLILSSLAKLGADFYEGVESARSNRQSKPRLKELGDRAVGLPLAPQFPDEFAVRLELRAWWLGRKIGKSDLNWIAFQGNGVWLKNHD